MEVAVAGCNGRLGKYLVDVYGFVPLNCDITDREHLKELLDFYKPDVVINCAAKTNVDKCEDAGEFSNASNVAIWGNENLLNLTRAHIIYMSTDYVFSGKRGPYREGDSKDPINNYGYSKWAGEMVLETSERRSFSIVRTTLLYGGHKPDFVTVVLDKLKSGEEFQLSEISGSPTYVPHLAHALNVFIDSGAYILHSVLHIAGSNVVTRYQFAREIARVFGYDGSNIKKAKTNKFGVADRPNKAGLCVTRASRFLPIYSLDQGLTELAENIKK